MRISTAYFHERSASGIVDRNAEVQETQLRMASGKRVDKAADDPVGAASAVRARASLAVTQRWLTAQKAAGTSLAIAESTLGAMHDVLASVRESLIAAGNPSYSASDRRTMGMQVRQALEQLVGLANTTDGDGAYLFAGYDNREAPFVQNGLAVSFQGDGGVRSADVGPGVRLQVTQSGDGAFMRLPSGNGVFAMAAVQANTGTGVAGTGRVTSAGAVTGHAYEVRFLAGGTTYDVWDLTAGAAVQSAQPFTPGATVAFDGIAFEITGAPAAGDVFGVGPAVSSSLFARIARAVAMLESPATGSAAGAWRASETNGILQDLDAASNRLLEARGAAGNALARIDALDNLAQDRELAQSTEIASIEDLDYAKAASELSARSLAYEAAMSAYGQLGRRSLFDYL